MEVQTLVDDTKKHLNKFELFTAIKVHSSVRSILSEFLKAKEYLEIPPVIVSPLTDPLNHPVFDPSIDYYGAQYALTKSMIFHKHILVQYMDKIFTFSPNIRLETADKISTGRHLTEFTQLDVEKKNGTRDEMIDLVEEALVLLLSKLKHLREEELKVLKRELKVPSRPFKRIRYTDAYSKYGPEFETLLSSELVEPFWIIDIPLKNREFYDREDSSMPEILVDMDLIYPEGFGEALSGGEREYTYEKIRERIRKKGQDEDQFKWYLEFAKKGLQPSAGFGIGIERLTRYICGYSRIEDVHPFPKIPGKYTL